jgi:hypothetical protein
MPFVAPNEKWRSAAEVLGRTLASDSLSVSK